MRRPFHTLIPLVVGTALAATLGAGAWAGTKSPSISAPMADAKTAHDQPTLIEFGLNGCVSCEAMHQILDELRAAHGDRLRVTLVNIQEQPELADQWEIIAIPTQILLDGQGREFSRHMGFLSAEAIRARFAAHRLPLDDGARARAR